MVRACYSERVEQTMVTVRPKMGRACRFQEPKFEVVSA